MKIAFLSFYSGSVNRGVETFVHELANKLVARGHQVIVYQNGPELPDAKYKTITIGIDFNGESFRNYIPFLDYFARRVGCFTLKVLRQIDKDVNILFPTNNQWQSLLCSFWSKFHKAKVVIAGQSGPGIDDRISLYTLPNAFVALTENQKEWAKRTSPFAKVKKIPNGVDLEKFNKEVRPINIKLPRPIILGVSAFVSWKRLDLVIKAVAELKEGSLLLAGEGKEEKKLRKLGKKLLPGKFKIMSFSHKDMPKVYSAADIFTFSTVPWESFGIVLVEAMASGLPVVASDDPKRREIVGNAGMFVNPRDTKKYAKTLKKALETDWGDKPRKQAEKFNWDDIAQEYEKLFRKLLK
jgi:glycosyltransferase involved in cell wall biosynthesis